MRSTTLTPKYLADEAKRILRSAGASGLFSVAWEIRITLNDGHESTHLVARAYRAGTMIAETSEVL